MCEEVRKSFPDTFTRTRLVFREIPGLLGYSSPYSLHMYIDIENINTFEWPEEALRGLFAHEWAHMVSYHRRSFLGRMLFVWNYWFSLSRRVRVEREADEIAIERGYGEDLVAMRISKFKVPYLRRLAEKRKIHASPEELREMIAEYQNRV